MYEVTEDDVTRAKNQLKAMQLFGIGNTGGERSAPMADLLCHMSRIEICDRGRYAVAVSLRQHVLQAPLRSWGGISLRMGGGSRRRSSLRALMM